MRITCWIPKATNTRSYYVIFIAFRLQRWLNEGTSMLLNMYIACLVNIVYSTLVPHMRINLALNSNTCYSHVSPSKRNRNNTVWPPFEPLHTVVNIPLLTEKWKPNRCYLLFYYASYRLNMFRALLCPSSGARDYDVDYHIGRFVLGLQLGWSSVRAAARTLL